MAGRATRRKVARLRRAMAVASTPIALYATAPSTTANTPTCHAYQGSRWGLCGGLSTRRLRLERIRRAEVGAMTDSKRVAARPAAAWWRGWYERPRCLGRGRRESRSRVSVNARTGDPTMRGHHCHALGCKSSCPPRWLMCRSCWVQVPPDIQAEVYRTVKLRGSHVDASWAPWWRAQAQ